MKIIQITAEIFAPHRKKRKQMCASLDVHNTIEFPAFKQFIFKIHTFKLKTD